MELDKLTLQVRFELEQLCLTQPFLKEADMVKGGNPWFWKIHFESGIDIDLLRKYYFRYKTVLFRHTRGSIFFNSNKNEFDTRFDGEYLPTQCIPVGFGLAQKCAVLGIFEADKTNKQLEEVCTRLILSLGDMDAEKKAVILIETGYVKLADYKAIRV